MTEHLAKILEGLFEIEKYKDNDDDDGLSVYEDASESDKEEEKK